MADKRRRPPEPPPEDDSERVTLVNLKGSAEERDRLRALTRKTGVPLSTIVRRGVAMWCADQGLEPPADWAAAE